MTVEQREKKKSKILEQGNVYFFYRPKVEEEEPESLGDIQRYYMVLSPDGKKMYRLAIIGRKRMPEIHDGGGREWGFIDAVAKDPKDLREYLTEEKYETKTRGERTVPTTRPAGEGIYSITWHGDHSHFVYALELPEKPDEVQQELNLKEDASYIITIKNPTKPTPKSAGLSTEQKAEYPQKLQKLFEDRRFYAANPPEFLDYEGTQFVLIGAKENPEEELGIEFKTEDEDENSAEIFRDMRLRKSKHPLKPLFEGKWD